MVVCASFLALMQMVNMLQMLHAAPRQDFLS
jgi:hypothetical protein